VTLAQPSAGTGLAIGRQAVFLDLDKTIIAKAAMSAFRGPLYQGGLLSRRSLARAFFAQLVYLHFGASAHRLARMRKVLLKLTKGWERARVAAIVEESLAGIVEPIIYAEAMDVIDLHRSEGRMVVIVSASPQEIVTPLSRYLGADESISSQAEVDENERYTGAMAFYAYGPHKAEAIVDFAEQHGIDLGASYAYSDSSSDLPMLECVGHPVAVNPDRALLAIAKERDWEILQFVHPIPLRDRVRDRVPFGNSRPAVALSFGAGFLSAGIAAISWWLGLRRHRRHLPAE
jgi:HAD superfamily hydrolase (TIGR01490 family)